MRDIRCMIRRHRWESRHNPEVEGPKGDYQTCARCGEDKAGYEPPPKNMYPAFGGKGRIGLPRRGRLLPKGTRGAETQIDGGCVWRRPSYWWPRRYQRVRARLGSARPVP